RGPAGRGPQRRLRDGPGSARIGAGPSSPTHATHLDGPSPLVIARSLRRLIVGMAGVLALATAGCRSEPGPELEYRVDLSAPAQGARVTLDVVRPPRDSLVLDAYATSELLGLSQVTAKGGDGRALPVRVRFTTSGDGAQRFP